MSSVLTSLTCTGRQAAAPGSPEGAGGQVLPELGCVYPVTPIQPGCVCMCACVHECV